MVIIIFISLMDVVFLSELLDKHIESNYYDRDARQLKKRMVNSIQLKEEPGKFATKQNKEAIKFADHFIDFAKKANLLDYSMDNNVFKKTLVGQIYLTTMEMNENRKKFLKDIEKLDIPDSQSLYYEHLSKQIDLYNEFLNAKALLDEYK